MSVMASPSVTLTKVNAPQFRKSPEKPDFADFSTELLLKKLFSQVCATKAIRHTMDLAFAAPSLHQQCILISQYCGINKDTPYSWYKGHTKPRLMDIIPLAVKAYPDKTLRQIAVYLLENVR